MFGLVLVLYGAATLKMYEGGPVVHSISNGLLIVLGMLRMKATINEE